MKAQRNQLAAREAAIEAARRRHRDIREASEQAFAQQKAEVQDCGSSRSQFMEKGAKVYAKA